MDKLKLRQICFLFAAVLPAAKLLIYPSTLSYYAKNDLLLSAALNFLLEGAVIALVMLLAQKTRGTFFSLLQNTFGQAAARAVYLLLALFLLASAVLPMLEQKNFVTQVLYENVPSVLSFIPFFAVCAFACTKGLKALGRIADIALPVFAVSVAVLLLLAAPHADLGALQPPGAAGARGIFTGTLFSLPWYTECLFPLLLLGHFDHERGAAWKVLLSFAAGAGAVLLFLALFYGIFAELTILTQYPLAHIAKYTTVFTTLGRADFLFIFAVALVCIFCLCIPLQLCVHCVREAFPSVPPAAPAVAVSAVLLILSVLLNYSFNAVQTLCMRYAFPAYLLFAYALPALSLLLHKTPPQAKARQNGRRRKKNSEAAALRQARRREKRRSKELL